jgi:UDPglucose 6-dehydrogenase
VTDDVAVVDDALLAAKDVEVLVVLTEWPQFRALDRPAVADVMRNPMVVDARNHFDPAVLRRAGIGWVGVGRR